jgi:predicted transposase YbfD/YdcC
MRNTIEEAIDGELIINCFSKLTDPRKRVRCLDQLIDIIVITICGILCGAEHWKEIAEFGRQRIDWLKQVIELEHGIPSEETFGRVFSLIPREELLACFIEWSTAITALPPGTIIAIDGKTLRKSYHKGIEQKPLHLINAYVTGQRITIGAIKTPDKSNEIQGIPPLLKSLNIAGCVITIDAMGTQKGIANLIKMRGADYVLALKKNHKTLYRAVEKLFNTASSLNYNAMLFKEDKTYDCEHSRIEHRFYRFLPIIYLPQFQKSWRGLQTIIEVRSFRDDNDGNQSATVRYFISSISLNKFQLIHQAIREHWAVENSLHWKLDVAMNEDNCRVYNPQAAENFSTLRKLVLHCLDNETKTNGGIAFKQWKAALSLDYLTKLINF